MTGLYNSTLAYDATTSTYDGELYTPIEGLPICAVFVAFDATPTVAEPDWTEITQYVRELSINRGRSNDYEQFRTATATITLDNLTRVFDPFNTASPYNGKLLPRRQVKVVAQANATNYTLYRGYIAGWPVTWTDNGFDSTITVECFDLFGLLARTELPQDWSYQTILDLEPYDWFRFDDDRNATQFRNQVPGRRGISISATLPPYKQPSIAPGIPSGSWSIVSAYQSTGTANFYNGLYSVCVWISNTSTFEAAGSSFDVFDYNMNISIFFYYNSTTPEDSNVYVSVNDYFQGFNYDIELGTRFFTFTPQHFAIVTSAAGAPTVYVNGAAVTPVAVITTALGLPFYGAEAIQFFNGQFQEAVVFRKALTADQIAQIYGFGAFGYSETTAARADRLLDLTGVPSALVDVTTTPVATVGGAEFGRYLLPELQTIADSEGGEVFVSRDGVLTFVDRWYSFGSPTSAVIQATFGESDIAYSGTFELYYDADTIRNEIGVRYTGDATLTIADDASIAAYGLNAHTIETRLQSATDALDLAEVERSVSAELKPTVGAIQVGNTRDLADWQAILGLDVLHRVQVERTPGTGSAFTQVMLVNAMSYRITPDRWSVSIEGSARLTGWFTADYSLTDGSDVVL